MLGTKAIPPFPLSAQGGRHLATARVVDVEPTVVRTPVLEHSNESPLRDHARDLGLECECNPTPSSAACTINSWSPSVSGPNVIVMCGSARSADSISAVDSKSVVDLFTDHGRELVAGLRRQITHFNR